MRFAEPRIEAREQQVLRAAVHMVLSIPAVTTTVAFAASDGGLAALQARLGAACPTGAGIGMVQVEVPMTAGGTDYAPDRTLTDFTAKNVTLVTQPSANSWHGTNVAQRLYGSSLAMARGVTDAWVYNANAWVNDPIKVGTATPTGASPSALVRVMNHSWIGSFGPGQEVYDRELLRRADYMMTRDGILSVSGENNGAGSARQPMMGDCFNGISVGRSDLQHSAGDTSSASDTPGRMKPEIIAPGIYTSFATPVVGSAAALLFEVMKGSAFTTLTNAQRAQVAKVCLLGGADRPAEWSNNAPASGASRGVATKPLDALRGCGELNVNAAHRMLTSTRVNGATSAAAALNVDPVGWGTASLGSSGKSYWRFRLYQPMPQLDVTLTWPRTATSNGSSYTFANLNMRLMRSLGGGSTLVPLDGSGGLATFDAGSVVSTSAVDNVEVVHLVNLQAGEYTLEVSRSDVSASSVSAYVGWIAAAPSFGLEGDVDGNGLVDFGDVAFTLLSYGMDDPVADVDANGLVDFGDIAIILLDFG
jgi:hypothetical protein